MAERWEDHKHHTMIETRDKKSERDHVNNQMHYSHRQRLINGFCRSAKQIEYDNIVYDSKKEFMKEFGIGVLKLKDAIRAGELNGKPIKVLGKKRPISL